MAKVWTEPDPGPPPPLPKTLPGPPNPQYCAALLSTLHKLSGALHQLDHVKAGMTTDANGCINP